MVLGSVFSGEELTAVTQPFYGHGVSGEALLLFTDTSMDALSSLMGYEKGFVHDEVELVLEMASLLNGSCITGFLSQLDISVLLKHPEVYGQHASLANILQQKLFPWHQTLAVELNYAFEGYDISCDLILLFHEDSLKSLFESIQFLIE
jgi:chemotaxis protein CheY-P-specific phosphatase CheC